MAGRKVAGQDEAIPAILGNKKSPTVPAYYTSELSIPAVEVAGQVRHGLILKNEGEAVGFANNAEAGRGQPIDSGPEVRQVLRVHARACFMGVWG